MTDDQYMQLMQSLFILNTGIQQLIDISMLMLPQDQRDVVDAVHNRYNKFLSDDTWVQDYFEEHGEYPNL